MFSNSAALLVLAWLATNCLNSTNVECASAVLWPTHVQLRPETSEVSVRCLADPPEPLVGCSFRVWAVEAALDGPLMDVVSGLNTSLVVAHPGFENDTLYVDLQGGDFATGRCGITVNGLGGVDILIGCKITTQRKSTAVNTMSVFFDKGRRFELDSNNKQLTVSSGNKATVKLYSNGVKLRRCETTMRSGDRVTVLPGSNGGVNVVNSDSATDRYAALGTDRMDKGQCGFRVANVTPDDAGVVFVRAEAGGGALVAAQALVIAVTTPFHYDMMLDKSEYSVGDNLTATCTVYDMPREQARAQWILDGRPFVYAGPTDFHERDWSWPWQQGVLTHTVTMVLGEAGKTHCLQCRVGRTAPKVACVKWRETTTTVSAVVVPTTLVSTQEAPPEEGNASMTDNTSTTAVNNWTNPEYAEETQLARGRNADLTSVGDDKKNVLITSSSSYTGMLVFWNFILMLLIVFGFLAVAFYARATRRWCFKDAAAELNRRNSVDTIYEEIPLEYLRSLQPPCIPPLPGGWDNTDSVPCEPAPPLPAGVTNPEYMILHEDTKDEGGYMEPRYRNFR